MYTVPSIAPKFKPALGQTYYFVGVPTSTHPNIGLLIGSRHWRNNAADKSRAAIGNVFKTFKEAQSVRKATVGAIKEVNS